jgi:hypothetical protein
MQFDGALLKEQGLTFAIAVVKPYVLNNSIECDKARQAFRTVFSNLPIILMAQNSRGIPTYQGRNDIVHFLAKLHISQIPWKTYNYN